MIYGYCRVSTQMQAKDGNSLEAQKQLLIENGAEEIYSDAFTGTKAHRPELVKLLAVLQSGDKLVITKLDRITGHRVSTDAVRQGHHRTCTEYGAAGQHAHRKADPEHHAGFR